MKDKKHKFTAKELSALTEILNKAGHRVTAESLLSLNDRLTEEDILKIKEHLKLTKKGYKITTKDMITAPGLLADVSLKEARKNKDKYHERRMKVLVLKTGLIEKVREEHTVLRELPKGEIIVKLLLGKISFPKGYSPDDILLPDD